jgi:spermidine synthase
MVGLWRSESQPKNEPTEWPVRYRTLYAGIFAISAATLLLELTLTRIFDVILWANMAHLVVSSAIFGLGLGGILVMLWSGPDVPTETLLARAAAVFGGAVLLLVPGLQLSPANLDEVPTRLGKQLLAFGVLYLLLLLPFVASGVVVAASMTRYAHGIHRLYFWDLVGAGIGCLGIFVLPSLMGAEATLLVIAAAGALSAALLATGGSWTRSATGLAALGLVLLTIPLANRMEFHSLVVKRGVTLGFTKEGVEFSRWDPISKIDILSQNVPWAKRIAYDGGSQSSALHQFDGDFKALREHYFDVDAATGRNRYNSGKYVALAHWLKRDGAPRTLVIGSAGGQETLAALAWGASHVDAVEMVCTVVSIVTGPYAAYTGHIFADPRVTVTCDEGRSFLRQSRRPYDIIQIHSNHTYSSLANGSGGTLPIYLQTVEAYEEYLAHLADDGVLQINYVVYPRMITTAARAWRQLFPGREFKRHLIITSGYPTLETFLVKRSAWTRNDIQAIRHFLSPAFTDIRPSEIIYAPGEPESRNVPDEFFRVPQSKRFERSLPYKTSPPTDDRPFFRDLRKGVRALEPDGDGYVPPGTVEHMNASLRGWVPMDDVHIYLLGGLSIVFSGVFVLVPLLWFTRRGLRHAQTVPTLFYFACLGAGFIMVELSLMYKFVLLIGFPIYSMATVLFTLLAAAGVGSRLSARLSATWGHRAILVILIFALTTLVLVVAFPQLYNLTLGMGQAARILLVAACLVPIGIPLGMPFPLGIEALHSRTPNLIPWAWGVNGFMTVVGSLLSVILSMKFGFNVTLFVAVGIYLAAMLTFLVQSRSNNQCARVG